MLDFHNAYIENSLIAINSVRYSCMIYSCVIAIKFGMTPKTQSNILLSFVSAIFPRTEQQARINFSC